MKNQKGQRHTCIICGNKRNKKYMVKIPTELTDKETITGLNRWVCLYTVANQRNNCIKFYIQRKKQYLQSKIQIIEQFEYDYQDFDYMKSKIQYPKIRICNNCNSLFIENAFTVFCCGKCKDDYLRKQKYKKPNKHKQAKTFKLMQINEVSKTTKNTCTICNKDISDKRKNAKYCSTKCKATARKEQKEHEQNLM